MTCCRTHGRAVRGGMSSVSGCTKSACGISDRRYTCNSAHRNASCKRSPAMPTKVHLCQPSPVALSIAILRLDLLGILFTQHTWLRFCLPFSRVQNFQDAFLRSFGFSATPQQCRTRAVLLRQNRRRLLLSNPLCLTDHRRECHYVLHLQHPLPLRVLVLWKASPKPCRRRQW